MNKDRSGTANDSAEAGRIRRAVCLVNEAQTRVDEAAAVKNQKADDGALARWQAAAQEFHQALGLLYSRDFMADLERLRTGETAAVERAVVFLEVDPWCFRSGYVKEKMLRWLPRVQFTPMQADRLRRVVLRTVDFGDRREFRRYCGLARAVDNDHLRTELRSRAQSPDPGIARRARWILAALDEPFPRTDEPYAQRSARMRRRKGLLQVNLMRCCVTRRSTGIDNCSRTRRF